MIVVLVEDRRGHQIPWRGNWRKFCVSCQPRVLSVIWALEYTRALYAFNYWTVSSTSSSYFGRKLQNSLMEGLNLEDTVLVLWKIGLMNTFPRDFSSFVFFESDHGIRNQLLLGEIYSVCIVNSVEQNLCYSMRIFLSTFIFDPVEIELTQQGIFNMYNSLIWCTSILWDDCHSQVNSMLVIALDAFLFVCFSWESLRWTIYFILFILLGYGYIACRNVYMHVYP